MLKVLLGLEIFAYFVYILMNITATYYSAKSTRLLLIITLAIAIVPALMLLTGFSWFLLTITFILCAILVPILFCTTYSVSRNTVCISIMGIPLKSVNIRQIRKVIKVRSHTNSYPSYSCSFNRLILEMNYTGKMGIYKIMISPKNEDDFICSLLDINPEISVHDKRVRA